MNMRNQPKCVKTGQFLKKCPQEDCGKNMFANQVEWRGHMENDDYKLHLYNCKCGGTYSFKEIKNANSI